MYLYPPMFEVYRHTYTYPRLFDSSRARHYNFPRLPCDRGTYSYNDMQFQFWQSPRRRYGHERNTTNVNVDRGQTCQWPRPNVERSERDGIYTLIGKHKYTCRYSVRANNAMSHFVFTCQICVNLRAVKFYFDVLSLDLPTDWEPHSPQWK